MQVYTHCTWAYAPLLFSFEEIGGSRENSFFVHFHYSVAQQEARRCKAGTHLVPAACCGMADKVVIALEVVCL